MTSRGSSIAFDDARSSSLFVSILNVVKICIGAGILSFPWAFRYGSLWPSIFICMFSAGYCLICGMLLVHGCENTGIFEYSALLRSISPWVEKVGAISICYVVFSTCLGYCILIPQFIQPAFSEMFGVPRFGFDDQTYILVAAPLILYPLCLLRDLNSLRFSSIIGIIAIFYCLGLFVYEAIEHHKMGEPGTASDPDADFITNQWTVGVFIVVNVASKANVCHYSLPPVYESLRNRSIKRMWIVMIVSYIVVTIIYLVFAICGYYLFGSDSEGNVLNNFGDEAGVAVGIARLGTAFSIFGCFPLIFKAGINALESQFFSEPDSKWNFEENPKIRVIVITVILAVLTLISLLLNDIGPVSSIEGAVTVLLLICAFPILIYWKIRFGGGSGFDHDHDGLISQGQMEMTNYRKMEDDAGTIAGAKESGLSGNDNTQKIGLGILFVLGIALGIAGMTVSMIIL